MASDAASLWIPALLWTLLFSAFLLFLLLPTRRKDWRSAGIYEAFLISLFVEMFGFPLTVYVVSAALGLQEPVSGSPEHPVAHFLGPDPIGMGVIVGTAFGFMAVGAALVALGWREIYRRRDELVMTGVYARMRHPQYLGLILMTFGLMLWWPTILTIPMWPVLAWSYARLAKREEDELRAQFGEAYASYKESVGRFFPKRVGRPPASDVP